MYFRFKPTWNKKEEQITILWIQSVTIINILSVLNPESPSGVPVKYQYNLRLNCTFNFYKFDTS